MTLELPDSGDCAFCEIVAGNVKARWEVSPDTGAPGITTVVCFHNRLKWARVMLLIVPTRHMTQKQFWSSHAFVDAASLTVRMGEKHCRGEGYRVISNFGRVAHQSQSHGHMHVVSGTSQQIAEARITSKNSLETGACAETSANGTGEQEGNDSFAIEQYDVHEVPFAAKISPTASSQGRPVKQRELWDSEQILDVSLAAQRVGERYSPGGYRLMSSFGPAGATENPAGNNPAGLFLLGGGQLGVYV